MRWIIKIPLFWILLGWIAAPIWLVYRLLMILMGFWKCECCKKWFWVKDEKVILYHCPYLTGTVCVTCEHLLKEKRMPPKSQFSINGDPLMN